MESRLKAIAVKSSSTHKKQLKRHTAVMKPGFNIVLLGNLNYERKNTFNFHSLPFDVLLPFVSGLLNMN